MFVPARSGGLNAPAGMAFGPDGDLYVASNYGDEVLRYDGSTGTFLGTFVGYQSGGLDEPDDLVFGPDGNLYVTSFRTDQVLEYDGTTGESRGVFAAGSERHCDLLSGSEGVGVVGGVDAGEVGDEWFVEVEGLLVVAGLAGEEVLRQRISVPSGR